MSPHLPHRDSIFERLIHHGIRPLPQHPQTGMPILDGVQLVPANNFYTPATLDTQAQLPAPLVSRSTLNLRHSTLLPPVPRPYREAFKDFASAEGIALGVNAVATWAMTHFTSSPGLLTATGPVVEKLGFFIWEGIKELLHPSSQASFQRRFLNMLKGTANTLKTDLLFHDTTYMALMRGALAFTENRGLPLSPAVVPWVSALCFAAAIPIAPWLEIKTFNTAFEIAKTQLLKKGMRSETYHELRFVLSDDCDPRQIMQDLSRRFGLTKHHARQFRDTYFTNTFPQKPGREVLARERKVSLPHQTEIIHHNLEIVMNKVAEHKTPDGQILQSATKQKFAASLKNSASAVDFDLGFFWNRRLKRQGSPTLTLEFLSYCAHNDLLRVDLDLFPTQDGKAVYLLEIKVYPEAKDLLSQVHAYLEKKFAIAQTTRAPHDVVDLLGNGE